MGLQSKIVGADLVRTKSVIAGLVLAGTISLSVAASQLGTSPRTLQRWLTQQGVSFWTLVDQSRFRIAGALLRETDVKVQEIACWLGYRTPSAFTRAFSRWAGCSPSLYRRGEIDEEVDWREMGRRGARRSVSFGGDADTPEEE